LIDGIVVEIFTLKVLFINFILKAKDYVFDVKEILEMAMITLPIIVTNKYL
jgi:hypothetical protein